ncbi:MAG: molybdopterin molybdotransferase MoeA [Candidatus Obscuribacterales bacterium]|nr:molybdopterin molybdotransferase MoeA [Candidatus Obscuribacterales bacterium]
MIPYDEARSLVLSTVQALPKTRVRLEKLLGMVIGEPIPASHDLPLFDNSAVDGYGVCLADVRGANEAVPVTLPVVAEIRAGDEGPDTLPSAAAFKIFTGALVPVGVDAVVMREHCIEEEGRVRILREPKAGENIRRRGEEYLRGQEILPEGVRVSPAVVGLLASLGQASFMVHKKPTVAIVTTGSELIKPGKPLTPGKIYDSNSAALKAACDALGVEDFLPLHCREDLNETRKVVELALDFADLVITVGGLSMGDHDYVKQVFDELSIKEQFYKVAVKPGKPVYFGTNIHRRKHKTQYVFGLPGNPVSALVIFNQLVKPAILKMMGQENALFGQKVTQLRAKLSRDLRKAAGRTELVRAVISCSGGELFAHPTAGQDSHMLGGLALANALLVFPQDEEHLAQGTMVNAELLNWYN